MSIYVARDFTCILSVILHFGFAECGFHAGKQKHCKCLLLPTTWSALLTLDMQPVINGCSLSVGTEFGVFNLVFLRVTALLSRHSVRHTVVLNVVSCGFHCQVASGLLFF